MSFGPRRPLGGTPARPARPAAVKKPSTVNRPTTTVRPDPQKPQPGGKPKSTVVSQVTARKPAAIAPKPSPPKPPTPDPVADYESDFESDESVPSSSRGQSSSSSSSASDVENSSHSKNSSSNESDDEAEEDDDDQHGEQSVTRYAARSESNVTTPPPPTIPAVADTGTPSTVPPPKPSRTRANARSMDILSKISLSDVPIDLYRFDPEDYFELRTSFGITTTIAHAKHTQTDTITVSTAQQTSGIRMQTRSTCMQQGRGFRGDQRADVVEEDRTIDGLIVDDDEDELQNYSSLQNIERMFSTLSGALERRFSKPTTAGRIVTRNSSANQQRAILQLVRNSAPIFETLLEGRRSNKVNAEHRRSLECHTTALAGYTGGTGGPVKVIRTFDMGKMSPEFEVRLVQNSDSGGSQGFVVECWANGTYTRPTYRFGSWSSIVCVDYDCRTGMMMFGGADDGSLQMWLGVAGHGGPIPPHQIVVPCVEGKYKLKCWQVVTVKVLPMVVVRESAVDTGCENSLKQVFALYSTGIIVVWHVQVLQRADAPPPTSGLSVTLGASAITLVQSKVIDINARLEARVPFDALRSYANLILHDHYQMVVSSDRTVIRLSHFVDSEYDPATLTQPDADHSIVTLKRMAQTTDTLFALYSNKTVRVLKLSTESGRGVGSARARYLKHDSHPNLLLSVCTNKSCTIQSIVHDEAKRRYSGTNNTSEGRADGGLVVASKQRGSQDDDIELAPRPRFHHGQQILFFGAQHPERLLQDERFNGTTGAALVQRS